MPHHARPRRGALTRLRDASVWGDGGIGDDDERIRGLLRVAFPALDVSLALFGLGGALYGIPALRDVFGSIYPPVWSAVIAVVAVGCLIGVGFPERFWRVEQAGKALLATLLSVYGGALIAAGVASGDLGRSAVAFIPVALVPILMWRVLDVAKDAKKNGWKGAPDGP